MSATDPDPMVEWDDVIVGAGSVGSVLAARLVCRPDRRVLLLEAGADLPPQDVTTSALRQANAPVLTGYNWDFRANALSGAAAPMLRSRFPYPLGKVVGGSSSVNGAIALRAFARDFDDWAALGNPDWAWRHVLPYVRAVENDPLHGTDGPIPIHRPSPQRLHPLERAFLDACHDIGLPYLDDLNGPAAAGAGVLPSNSVEGVRVGPATAYLADARAKANLRVRTGSMVTRVLMDGRRAVGVETLCEGRLTTVRARNVTLSAGGINTPLILLRSGIGDAGRCRSLGIEPIIDLPGVGQNLIDHPSVVMWAVPRDDLCVPGAAWHQVAARAHSDATGDTDLQLALVNNAVTADIPDLGDLLGGPMAVAVSAMLLRPSSRGQVFLDDPSPSADPVIELSLCSTEDDLRRLAQGVRMAWRILRAPAFAARLERVHLWNDELVGSDRLLRSVIGNFVSPTWHPVGSARMGPGDDPMSVVDQRGLVHGLERLRVVDASIMPKIPSVAPNLTCITLAERMAAWMSREANR